MRGPHSLVIAQDKLTKYLLNIDHPRGRSKAKFFIAHGFSPSDPDTLAEALYEHAESSRTTRTNVPSAYGSRVVVSGPMNMPDGTSIDVVAVWQVDESTDGMLTFITARPD